MNYLTVPITLCPTWRVDMIVTTIDCMYNRQAKMQHCVEYIELQKNLRTITVSVKTMKVCAFRHKIHSLNLTEYILLSTADG